MKKFINKEVLKKGLADNEILEFESVKELREYLKIYCYESFESNKEMFEFLIDYYFKYNNKHYLIEYDYIKESIYKK